MHVGWDMKNSWKMFDHVKHLKDYTTLMCHVYNSKYSKVLTTICCDIQFEGGTTHDFFSKYLKLCHEREWECEFQGFCADSAHANWMQP